jgi:transcriptional regulator with GAF, ATPase, and Fis domain
MVTRDVTQAYPLEAPQPRATANLRWTDATGPREARVDRPMIIGSAAEAQVTVHDRTVSRAHAAFEPRSDGLWVVDHGSRNGTFVGDIRVESARLPQGGRLRLGGVEIAVAYGAVSTPDVWPEGRFGRLIGRTAIMRELFANVARYAATEFPVLVHGETGTGKELVAQAIHEASAMREGPLVVVDCAALPPTLLESELFGHVRGAFTGADQDRPGAFETAEGGTIFIDELGELPLGLQPKLLRVLESRTVRRVGESTYRPVKARFVFATHRDLRAMVALRSFREDLFFRLAVLTLEIPPLRARRGDIPMLLDLFLAPRRVAELPQDVLAQIVDRPWPGNVRELRNFAAQLSVHGFDRARDLVADGPPASVSEPILVEDGEGFKAFRERWIEQGERVFVTRALEAAGGNIAKAARDSGVDRTYMFRLVKKLGLG